MVDVYVLSSRGQQKKDGSPAFGLEKNLITLHCKQLPCSEILLRTLDLLWTGKTDRFLST
jgi:hypothetical protein